MREADDMLRRMLGRGDRVAVKRGLLFVGPASGQTVPPEWLEEWEMPLIASVAKLAGVDVLEYLSYSVGQHGRHKAGGVSLTLQSLMNGRDRYVIFNAEVTRARNSRAGKKGERLPREQFRVTERHEFARFWRSTGQQARRWSGLHQYMGNLKKHVFIGSPTVGKPGRLDAKTVKPFEMPYEELVELYTSSNTNSPQTTDKQDSDNSHTAFANKQADEGQYLRGSQPGSGTGDSCHGNKVIRKKGSKGCDLPPELQTDDEWLNDRFPPGCDG